ncbi:hypothetical protein F5876DRAFT_79126 [Lentinula aff. lateritia]|uniref:Uncharacterized protein n=1 Tax=Lentinula aff. lateritia TaxID=2804960 RepID=A0ACC1TTF2_9AGAR|nr:hypothetical protein F5876DRAFT_79126 [Lentinula aff. lateritia]
MLLLPPSLLRSLSLSVLIFPIILGVLAMPLASHDDGLSTIPQLKLRDNRKLSDMFCISFFSPIRPTGPLLGFRKHSLNLKRYNMSDSLLHNVPCRGYKGLLLLDFHEKWALSWGTTHLFRPIQDPAVHGDHEANWKIRRIEQVNPTHQSNLLGNVIMKDMDKQEVFDAIAKIPPQVSQFLAIQKIIEYLLGELEIHDHPLPEDLLYTPQQDWKDIFLAMTSPKLQNQYPCSPYLKLAPTMSRSTWTAKNKKSRKFQHQYLPYLGTAVEEEVRSTFLTKFNSTLWDSCQTLGTLGILVAVTIAAGMENEIVVTVDASPNPLYPQPLSASLTHLTMKPCPHSSPTTNSFAQAALAVSAPTPVPSSSLVSRTSSPSSPPFLPSAYAKSKIQNPQRAHAEVEVGLVVSIVGLGFLFLERMQWRRGCRHRRSRHRRQQ